MMFIAALTLLSAASAGDLQVGVGLRDPQALPRLLSQGTRAVGGAQGLVRYDLGWVALESDLFVNPFLERYTDLDAVLVQITANSGEDAEPSLFIANEVATLQLLADVGPPTLRWSPGERAWTGGPRLLGGLWVSAQYQGELTAAPGAIDGVLFVPEGWAARGGPALGLGMDAWYKGLVGLRLSWLARISPVRSANAGGVSLQNDSAFTVDLLVNP